ncbi:hypothetical protein D3C80_1380050 [compost metagenome]
MHDGASAAGTHDHDLDIAGICSVPQVMAQPLAKACVGPAQQAIALLEVVEAQHPRGGSLLGDCHQLLHRLHHMAQALRRCIAQPVRQVLLKQSGVTCLQDGFGADFVPELHGFMYSGVLVG